MEGGDEVVDGGGETGDGEGGEKKKRRTRRREERGENLTVRFKQQHYTYHPLLLPSASFWATLFLSVYLFDLIRFPVAFVASSDDENRPFLASARLGEEEEGMRVQ